MSMPVITPGTVTRDQAISDLIQSVALGEAALSHILNAEGEKLQAVVAIPTVTPDQLLDINQSVASMVNAITRLEIIFQSKLELFGAALTSTTTTTTTTTSTTSTTTTTTTTTTA